MDLVFYNALSQVSIWLYIRFFNGINSEGYDFFCIIFSCINIAMISFSLYLDVTKRQATKFSELLLTKVQTQQMQIKDLYNLLNESVIEKYLALNRSILIRISLIIALATLITILFESFNPLFLDIMVALFIAVLLRYYILLFRIEKGLFAENYYEAKELIEFIESKNKNGDDHDGDAGGRAFPRTKEEEISTVSSDDLAGEAI